MKFDPNRPAARLTTLRGVIGFAGACSGCLVLATVTVLFGDASDTSWLADPPDNRIAMQRCDGVKDSAERRHCAEEAVLSVTSGRREWQVAHCDRQACEEALAR